MKEKVLIAYVSSSGSTQEIAQEITKTLQSQSVETDLQEMKNVRSLAGYSSIVLGIPLYMFRWHSAAHRFFSRHKKMIRQGIPVAIFSGGPTETGDEKEWKMVHEHVEKELAKITWLNPVSVKMVGGRLDPAKLGLPWKLIPAMRNLPVSDLRDWDDIRNWANSLPAIFSQSVQQKQSDSV